MKSSLLQGIRELGCHHLLTRNRCEVPFFIITIGHPNWLFTESSSERVSSWKHCGRIPKLEMWNGTRCRSSVFLLRSMRSLRWCGIKTPPPGSSQCGFQKKKVFTAFQTYQQPSCDHWRPRGYLPGVILNWAMNIELLTVDQFCFVFSRWRGGFIRIFRLFVLPVALPNPIFWESLSFLFVFATLRPVFHATTCQFVRDKHLTAKEESLDHFKVGMRFLHTNSIPASWAFEVNMGQSQPKFWTSFI